MQFNVKYDIILYNMQWEKKMLNNKKKQKTKVRVKKFEIHTNNTIFIFMIKNFRFI